MLPAQTTPMEKHQLSASLSRRAKVGVYRQFTPPRGTHDGCTDPVLLLAALESLFDGVHSELVSSLVSVRVMERELVFSGEDLLSLKEVWGRRCW
jgi:hypothetical protein